MRNKSHARLARMAARATAAAWTIAVAATTASWPTTTTAAAATRPGSTVAPVAAAFTSLHERDWKRTHTPEKEQTICFQIAIKHDAHTLATMDELLFNISSPTNAMYGQYMSSSDMHAFLSDSVSPSQDAIMDWLSTSALAPANRIEPSGVSDPMRDHTRVRVGAAGDFIDVCTSVAKTESLFQTTLHGFERTGPIAPGDLGAEPRARTPGAVLSSSSGIRATTDLVLPTHLLEHIDFVGGINTPIHQYQVKPVPQQQSASKVDDSDEDDSCEIAAAYASLLPPPASSNDATPSLFVPKVLELKAGNEQAYIRWSMGCGWAGSHSPALSCSNTVRAFHIMLQPMDNDPNRRGTRLTHIAASIPLQLADCKPEAASSGTSMCKASFPLKNYVGYWMTLRVELIGASPNSPSSFVSSCVRGPLFGHELVSSAFLQKQYHIPASSHTLRHPNSTIAIVSFLEQYWNNRDLQTYLSLMNRGHDIHELPLVHTHEPSLVGFNNETEAIYTGDEAQLDVQVVMGLLTSGGESDLDSDADVREATAAGSVSMWNIPGREPQNSEEPFLRWVLTVQELANPPLVYSLSYGDQEDDLPLFYMQRLNIEFQKMALRGMTIVFPSGDKGVASDFEPEDKACERSRPEFPVSSPYVLAVGASQLSSASTRSLCSRLRHHLSLCSAPTEVACSADLGGGITTGGGFSNKFPRPAFQNKQVTSYLRKHKDALPKAPGYFNPDGRGYPDIAAYGTHFVTINNGVIVPAAGTSASVPAVAAMVALWNDIRLGRGEPPLGLIAPFLYSLARTHPHAFRDIVDGSNRCRMEEQTCCEEGFQAANGWDAVSGLGAPRFDVIAQLLQQGYPRTMTTPATISFAQRRQVSEAATSLYTAPLDAHAIIPMSLLGLLIGCVLVLVVRTCVRAADQHHSSSCEQQPLVGV